MPLEQRHALAKQTSLKRAFPFHTPDTHRPSDEGDDLKLFFSPVLALFDQMGLYRKMANGKPKAARPDKFHADHWKRFVKGCEPPWMQMSVSQKAKHLRSWLVHKFSLDPDDRCMLPGNGRRRKTRNDIGWVGFEMSDDDLDTVMAQVIAAYQSR